MAYQKLEFDYVIVYKKEKLNGVADALSRIHESDMECAGLHITTGGWKEELKASLGGDTTVQELQAQLAVT